MGGFGTYSNTPTITYTPLAGNKFIRSLATPLPPEAVFSGIQSGMPADVILSASLVSINGLKNQEATLNGIARADPDFHRVQALAREIQISGAMRIVVEEDRRRGDGQLRDVPDRKRLPRKSSRTLWNCGDCWG